MRYRLNWGGCDRIARVPDFSDEDLAKFVSASIPSVWALESLLLLKRASPETRRKEELVSQLRSSDLAIAQGLNRLEEAGLVAKEDDQYCYRPASAIIAALGDEIERIYALKPIWLMQIILRAKHDNLQVFANSFRLKE
jgi:DNA-binding HxlR family transcriptional regulator